MKIYRKLLTVLIAGAGLCGSVAAQETEEFDLASQRSESQHVLPVPGKKLEHEGIVVNPTPHVLTPGEGRLDFSQGFVLRDKSGRLSGDIDFLPLGGKTPLTIEFGGRVAAKASVRPLSGAYSLRVGPKGVSIAAYDERGAFYGLQTLRQLVASPAAAGGTLPCLTIEDWPDLPLRGVVEGFYGTPWSHRVRLSLIDFYGRFKMNSYLYGPKDDPYHSCPNWRLPYPEREAANIRELVEACNRNRVDFVWAIHPGQDIKWNEEDYGNLVAKFEMMYDLGVRSFAIFFDDISGEGTDPVRQVELLNRLTAEFVRAKGDVAPLIVCPTDYSRLWANPTPRGALSIYGKRLDPSINVFWTGDVVCSDLTRETLDWVNSRIERPAFYWWNFPVTDYARHIVMMGPTYGLDTTLDAGNLCGFVSNPMEHGEASKVALYSVADYTWNIADYNALDSWERALEELTPEAAEAFRTFAIHSCDTETGYRRDESWETETFTLGEYTPERSAALMREFVKIEGVPEAMERGCANEALLAELRPWLAEFGALGTRGRRALEAMELYRGGDDAAFWAAYVRNRMSDAGRESFGAHKCGTLKLQPFYERAMDDMAYGFYTRIAGELPLALHSIGSYGNARGILGKLMFDDDASTYYTSSMAQKEGDWIGADLGCVRELREVRILQGRNSTDDVDYFDHALVEASKDGRSWQPLTGPLREQYEIEWRGEPVEARYVRLRRLESERKNWASVRLFEVNPVRSELLGFELQSEDAAGALRAFDRNPGTSFANHGVLGFGIPEGVGSYVLLLDPAEGSALSIRQFAGDGTLLREETTAEPFVRVELASGAARMELAGDAEVFEIIPR